MTELLKKGNFDWNEAVDVAFQELKRAMSITPVFELPDFSLPFIIEMDACYGGFGAVLMQDRRPLAYLSKGIYEKELLALVTAVSKWRHYLEGHHFIIKTDLLEQRITTPLQQKWLSKLLGLSYEIQYKQRVGNRVVDALSRREEKTSECLAITEVTPMWIGEVITSYQGDREAEAKITVLLLDSNSELDY